ncbi:MAG: DUF1540 domain-containing protein [Clostridia bacterium]|nr:DUF1540 domain-containing protein [Clostridia bacterium]
MSDYTNRGVNCTVDSCRYHCGKDCCNAPVIAVRGCGNSATNGQVSDKSETSCATYESCR